MDKYEKLKGLKSLLDNGLLNQDEFEKLKNEILFANNKGSNQEQNEPKKTNIERNILEEITYKNRNVLEDISKNNTKSNIETPSKNKNNNGLILLAVFLGVLIFFSNLNKNDKSKESTIDSTITSSENKPIENSSTKCIICGRIFSGDGYDKIDGVWQKNTNMQTELCSQNCAMIEDQRQNQKYNTILQKHGYPPINSQGSTSNHVQTNSNGYFTGSDGQLHQSSPCGNCHHTGYINMGDGIQVCPMCNGRGETIH